MTGEPARCVAKNGFSGMTVAELIIEASWAETKQRSTFFANYAQFLYNYNARLVLTAEGFFNRLLGGL